MKTLSILFLILGYSFTALAQDENKFSLTIEYSPNFSKISNEILDESYKLSHNALLRIRYNLEGRVTPTVGLGFLNTGEQEVSDTGLPSDISKVRFIHNYNYVYIPIGAKINFNNFHILPEIGLGINVSNKSKQVVKYTNGEKEKEKYDEILIAGEFNKVSIPLSLSLGYDFILFDQSFSTGIKGYYSINQVVKDVPRKNHYYGLGLVLAINL